MRAVSIPSIPSLALRTYGTIQRWWPCAERCRAEMADTGDISLFSPLSAAFRSTAAVSCFHSKFTYAAATSCRPVVSVTRAGQGELDHRGDRSSVVLLSQYVPSPGHGIRGCIVTKTVRRPLLTELPNGCITAVLSDIVGIGSPNGAAGGALYYRSTRGMHVRCRRAGVTKKVRRLRLGRERTRRHYAGHVVGFGAQSPCRRFRRVGGA
jgi:hypothetical protein